MSTMWYDSYKSIKQNGETMNPQQTPQQPTQTEQPGQPPVVSGPQAPDPFGPTPPSQFTPPPAAGGSKKKMILIIVAVLALLGIGGAVALVMMSDKKEDPTPAVVEEKKEEDTQTQSSETKEFSLTDKSTGTKIAMQVPSDWVISGSQTEPGETGLLEYEVTTGQGIIFSLREAGGVGGDCPDDNYTFTLTHKVATATKDIYFTEYSSTNPEWPINEFAIEDFNDRKVGNTTQEEGDTATNSCNLPSYPIIGNIYVSTTKGSKAATYDDVAKDAELLKAISTLTVTQ